MKYYKTQSWNAGEPSTSQAVRIAGCHGARILAVSLIACAMLLLTARILAQNYSIPWHSTGADVTSSGGNFSLTGTIDPSPATPLSGGSYTLSSGYWSIIVALQHSGSPMLRVAVENGQIVLSWPSAHPDFTLETSPDLNSTTWSIVTSNMSTNGDSISVTVPNDAGYRFYRLRK